MMNISLCKNINLFEEGFESVYLKHGWAFSEFWGCWNLDPVSTLSIPFERPILPTKILLGAYSNGFDVYIDGVLVVSIDPSSVFGLYELDLQDSNILNLLNIEFKSDKSHCVGLRSVAIYGTEAVISTSENISIDFLDSAQLQRPVFITGFPRSGTTALTNLIAKKFGYTDFPLETFFFAAMSNYHCGSTFQTNCINSVLADKSALDCFNIAKFEFERSPSILNFKKIAHIFFGSYIEKYGANRLIEKTPEHFLYLDLVFNTFEDATVFCSVRDPLSIFLSMRKRLLIDSASSWLGISVEEHIVKSRYYYDRVLYFKSKFPKNLHVFSYQQIVQQSFGFIEAMSIVLNLSHSEVCESLFPSSSDLSSAVPKFELQGVVSDDLVSSDEFFKLNLFNREYDVFLNNLGI